LKAYHTAAEDAEFLVSIDESISKCLLKFYSLCLRGKKIKITVGILKYELKAYHRAAEDAEILVSIDKSISKCLLKFYSLHLCG
jgi:hypothetical protein